MSIEAMDKFYVLRMMHQEAKFISDSIVQYRDVDDKRTVIIADLDGNELYKALCTHIVVVGKFVLVSDTAINPGELVAKNLDAHIPDGKFTLFNCDTHKEIKKEAFTSSALWINYISDEHLLFSLRPKVSDENIFIDIYDKDFNITDRMPCASFNCRITILKETTTHVTLATSLNSARGQFVIRMYRVTMVFNKLTGKIEQYQSRDGADGIGCIATDINTSNSQDLSICNECIEYLQYKLSVNGVIVTERSYQDISKPSDLTYTPYFYTYERGSDFKPKRGLIDISGKELLEPLYDGIRYIGSNNFILLSNGFSMIYNVAERKIIVDYTQNNGISSHSQLPLTVINGVDKQVYCLDTRGNFFPVKDLSRYFECYRSEQFFGIKVNIGNGLYKYVDEQLNPITNIRLIGQLQAYTWVRI